MSDINYIAIRESLSRLPSDHDASGEHKPTVDEIFAPEQHANALDPNTSVVVGARGTGKSFWAGVLSQNETRIVASEAYPNLGLDNLIVTTGYDGFISPLIIDSLVPKGKENSVGYAFWQAAIIRSVEKQLSSKDLQLSEIMERYANPEKIEVYFDKLDVKLEKIGRTLLITFDALDRLSKEWGRSTLLLDALFEVAWGLRARKRIKAKIFIRPEQLNDESLRFVEIPKLRSSRIELEWSQVELYGLLFSRLAYAEYAKDFHKLSALIGAPFKNLSHKNRRSWSLVFDKDLQKNMMTQLTGPYMGKNFKKGGTYDWPYKHLADANGNVTPRSFIKLFAEAAKVGTIAPAKILSAEGIRHGLREASKVRVDQLSLEYQWVKRALAPLAGLSLPCKKEDMFKRWRDSDTIPVIMEASRSPEGGFLPPFPPDLYNGKFKFEALALTEAMEKIGLMEYRADGRVDIPDLFRIAAMMLKKGGTTPLRKN
ncbi:hypothetical protein [Acerihabitans arboris]|uniref:Uncharacterized protein n=1 Tax=Acerihabitans arboris TaxID=2691583 RepID=A0A845SMB3_9GAMM|nr:hypothetical protein [Acerihabitans arboris]NDL63761.1 hypothetical protein [Acerihabitans arboris]